MELTKIVYFWYDHMVLRSNGDADRVKKAIQDHDFETFMAYKKRYGKEYFPDTAAMIGEDGSFIGNIDITIEENFNKITRSEFECG